jgi:hypothetical protein
MRSAMHEFSGIRIPQSLDEVISPQNTALIIYDMQVVSSRKSGMDRKLLNE